MSRERVIRLGLVAALLIGGLLLGQHLARSREGGAAQVDQTEAISGFRDWYWEARAPDLAVQMALIFVGALGVAALLPGAEDKP